MKKQEAADKLCALGYNAAAVDGVVQVLINKPMTEKEVQKLEQHLIDMGYRSSWGWKVAG